MGFAQKRGSGSYHEQGEMACNRQLEIDKGLQLSPTEPEHKPGNQ
jgi:hypothetical protein